MSLSCAEGVIRVLSSRYGRFDESTCAWAGNLAANCHAGGSLQNARQRCDGRASCNIYASYTIFGDPCSGISKGMVVSYGCVRSDDITKPVEVDCSLSLPTDGLDVYINADSYAGGDIVVHGNAGLTLNAKDTTT